MLTGNEISTDTQDIHIAQQKLVHRLQDGKQILALVYHDPVTGKTYWLEDEIVARLLELEIIRNHILTVTDVRQRDFYRKLADRMVKGYQIEPAHKIERTAKHTPKARRGRGLR